MTEQEIRHLHQRTSNGEQLTSAELSILQDWYDENDESEDLLINRTENRSDSANISRQLSRILAQVSQSANRVEQLAHQNELLKQENESLRRAVENRLLEKVA